MHRSVILVAVLLACSSMAAAQAPLTGPAAPKDRAMDLPLELLQQAAKEIAASGEITKRVLEGGTFSVNVRHITGAETALQHGKIAEVWVVREGTGTVATGGTLVDSEPGNGPGEFRGKSIRGGVERVIKAGDLVYIPPGVPHGIKQATAITYLNIRFEIK